MELAGPALRVTIFVGEDDRWQHKPLYHEIVKRTRDAGRSCRSSTSWSPRAW